MDDADPSRTTCWTIVRGAAAGERGAREEVARRYLPVVRAYLARRWAGSARIDDLDDAVQELFLELFRAEGALERLDPSRTGGFRAYLYGVARTLARRVEARGARARGREEPQEDLELLPAEEETLSRAFDRAWALALVQESLRVLEQGGRNDHAGGRHAEILRMRFAENLPVREIASRRNEDPAAVHRQYARARDAFKEALFQVVAEHHGGSRAEIERECELLLEILRG
jgi:RNA polymerase sigma-70 factor (ECF subfamily)